MRNASGSFWFPLVAALRQALGPPAAAHGLARLLQLAAPPGVGGDGGEVTTTMSSPLLFRALASLNLLLLVAYLLLLLLAKLAARLHRRSSTAADDRTGDGRGCEQRAETTTFFEAEDAAAADMAGGARQPDVLFWFDEAVFQQDSALLLGDEGKDHHHPYTATAATARCLQVEDTFPAEESARISPRTQEQDRRVVAVPEQQQQQQQVQEEEEEAKVIVAAADIPTVPAEKRNNAPAVVSPENVSTEFEGKKETKSSREEEAARRDDGRAGDDHGHGEEVQEEKSFSGGQQHHDNVKLFVNSRALADTRRLLLEGVVAGGGGARLQQKQEEEIKDRNNGDSSRFGASTLASESTSKSSVEWRSSTVTKDSETEYPFSSSSRRSSARWESYTLFRKYDEDMVYFHRVGAQKLTETESFRSIKHQPRSMSERLVRRLTPRPSAPIGLRDPFPDLERAYVAQVCLTWEALNWNYTSFRRHGGGGGGGVCCPARVAQEFQQFQVLLHRFVENEPYEDGRRPEVYARMKNSTPKLLLVPEFRDEEDEKDDLISAFQFLMILEDAIRTFMAFLRADKRSHYEMFREMVRRRSSAVDQTLVFTLKKANKKKKSRLKDLTRPRRCLRRTRLREEEELSVLLGLIDLKVVARVLRMPEITDQQLHWCEEKMNRVRIDPAQGKMQRDPSPLFYPAH